MDDDKTRLFTVDGVVGSVVTQIGLDVIMLDGHSLIDSLQLAAEAAGGVLCILDDGVRGVQALLCLVVVVLDVVVAAAEEVETAGDDEADGTDGTLGGGGLVSLCGTYRR